MTQDNHIPASIRLPDKDFDSCLIHVDYNIEKLSEMLNNEEPPHLFEVLNYITIRMPKNAKHRLP